MHAFWSGSLSALLVFVWSQESVHAAIFAPGDNAIGVVVFGEDVIQGSVGTVGGENNWPANESPSNAIDGVGFKYRNFGVLNTGLIVTPSGGPSTATSISVWTADDAESRDPASFELWGTNSTLDGISFQLSEFDLISSGNLELPPERNVRGAFPLLAENSQTVEFSNTRRYDSYLIVFPTVKDETNANAMQIAEVQLHGTFASGETIVPEPRWATLASMLAGLLGVDRRHYGRGGGDRRARLGSGLCGGL